MEKDRRSFVRYPSFGVKDIYYKNNNSKVISDKIILRDESHQGYGVTYVGQNSPADINRDHNIFMKISDDYFAGVSISWEKKVAKNVYLFGFEVLINEIHKDNPAGLKT